jgi:hypothetical protein
VRVPDGPRPRWWSAYQLAVLGMSAAVVVFVSLMFYHGYQAVASAPGSLQLGLTAAGQVIGTGSSKGPAPNTLPGIVGTATASSTPTVTSTRTPVPSHTMTPTLTPTATIDVRTYDPNRAKVLLAQAQTSWGTESPAFEANVTTAAGRLNGRQIAPGAEFSFKATTGPYDSFDGYRYVATGKPKVLTATVTSAVPTLESGITQVSTTLFQAVFWSGLKILERKPHPSWLDRFNAGSTGQRGLDAFVSATGPDLRFTNSTDDWIRIEAAVQSGSITVSIYGADPGWSVEPTVGQPGNVVQPRLTPVTQIDPSLPSGQQISLSSAAPGFDVSIQRIVTKSGQELDRYGEAEHYLPVGAVVAVGPVATATVTPTVTPTAGVAATVAATPAVGVTVAATATPVPATRSNNPDHLAGLNPSSFVLPDGRIRAPSLVGLSENEAQQVIMAVGLATSFVNYQGPGDIPAEALNSVDVGQVLSQTPRAGTAVPKGTAILIAVRKG